MDPKTELITTLKELYFAVEEGATDKVKRKINWLYQDLERNKQLLRELHTSGSPGATQTDLIIAICRNRQAKFRNNETEFRNNEAEFRNKEAEFREYEAEFRNREAEFRNKDAEFREYEAEFRNREAEFRNKEAEFREYEEEFHNRKAVFCNKEAVFYNNEPEISNRETEFCNIETEFRNVGAEFRYIEAEFSNNEAEFRKNEAGLRKNEEEFRKNEAEFCNRETEFRNIEAAFCNTEAEFRNSKEEFRSREEEFRNREAKFRIEEEKFRNNESEFHKNEEEFCNIETEFRKNEAEFRKNEAEFRKKEAEFRNKERESHKNETDFRNKEEEFRKNEAEFRNREAEFCNNEAEFRIKETVFRTGEVEFRDRLTEILYYLLLKTDILDHFPGADFDDTEVKTQRTEAFKQALSWDAFTMVEMLYDYWIGDLHRIGHNFNKIKTLGEMLDAARVVCTDENKHLHKDVYSLVQLNAFQQELYSSISNISTSDVATMLVEVLRIYDEYSEDNNSDYDKIFQNYYFEVYFRKMDFNVALLMLENWAVLRTHFKQRFNKPHDYFETNPSADSRNEIKDMVSVYKEIESALYHFIYRTCEDWRLYLPKDRQITIEKHNTSKIAYDEHKLNNGPVLFLERKSFNERLKQFKNLLMKYVISVDPAIDWAQNKGENFVEDTEYLLDDNYLTPTMYMSDYYSLRKIVYYIEAIENTNKIPVLMIERVLQVTGEMIKSSNETIHLLDFTKSLLQIAISVETVKYLSEIRTFLSKAKKGYLSIRIDIENYGNPKFNEEDWKNIKNDLQTIKQLINSVLDIYKPILDKSLLEKGKRLLDERIDSFPQEAAQHIDELNRLFDIHRKELIESDSLLQELIDKTGLPIELLKEIIWIRMNKDDISSKIQSAKTDQQMFSILPRYIQNIRQTLQLIDQNNRDVEYINQQFTNQLKEWKLMELPNNPENDDITKRRRKVEKIQRKNRKVDVDSVLQKLNEIKSYSIHWKAINKMLSFCYDECELFGTTPQIVNDVSSVIKILYELDDTICKSISSCKNVPKLDGTAIKKLHDIFEKQKSTKIDRKELISWLISRVNLLKQILQYSDTIPLEQYLRKYRHDLKIRFELEMVLADIGNVFVGCNIKRSMAKSSKLLSKIDLGNVLDHGNPFLDVIVDVFDSCDVLTELLSKAIMFAKDAESIEALFELFKANVNYDIIKKEDINQMNDQQKDYYNRFQKSPNWQTYAELIK